MSAKEYAKLPHSQETKIRPCNVNPITGKNISPFHILSCGHLAAVNGADWSCALNCFYTASIASPSPDSVPDVNHIYCESCQNLPISSYEAIHPAHHLRPALSPTQIVIGHYTDYDEQELAIPSFFARLSRHRDNPQYIHRLLCGHEVFCATPRSCASNCKQQSHCPSFGFRASRLDDAIVCRECVSEAEKVYFQFASTGGVHARDIVQQYGVLIPSSHPVRMSLDRLGGASGAESMRYVRLYDAAGFILN
ncbi:unnamed protein product [Periconia digitata]|uniref:Uncharacterized protein n=1 Tax=Periconia digitata TaxID=1303443 RepID=A0A9W4UH31_9PLEO|nr:unnamed protein product [Periconia digitata]